MVTLAKCKLFGGRLVKERSKLVVRLLRRSERKNTLQTEVQ